MTAWDVSRPSYRVDHILRVYPRRRRHQWRRRAVDALLTTWAVLIVLCILALSLSVLVGFLWLLNAVLEWALG